MLSSLSLNPPFAFWQFASGWMLLWGLAATIPILIHLWSKRKYREESWAAMEFLLAAMRNNARRIRMEQLILLLIRTAILALLAFALADPLFSFVSGLTSAIGGGQTHWILVLDGSYSMDYMEGEKKRFKTAQELATRVVKESTQGDGFTLILMGDRPQVTVSKPVFSPADMEDEIASLRMRHGGANLGATLAEIDSVIRGARQTHARLRQHQVCFFTDLDQITWEETATDRCRRQIGALAETASLLLYDVGTSAEGNLAISNLTVRESVVTMQRDVLIEAEVKNFGSQPHTNRKVQFFVDGRRVADRFVNVRAGGEATVSVLQQFDSPGEHAVEARLDEDPLQVDNHRWLSIPVRESIDVLCVRGKPGAARHVNLALNPTASEQPRIRVTVEPESAILESNLRQYACVFLCNVARLGRDDAQVLNDYLLGGGGLVVSLGDQVQADNYNEQLVDVPAGRQVLPARLGEVVTNANYFFDPLDYRHPIITAFRGYERSGLLTTPVWRFFQLEPVSASQPQSVLAFDGGAPAMLEMSLGRGRCVLFASAFSNTSFDRTTTPPTPWTAMTTWPSFPPLIQETLNFAMSGVAATRNVEVGNPIGDNVRRAALDASLVVQGPGMEGGMGDRVLVTDHGERAEWTFDQTWWSGIYEAEFAPPINRSELFTVNTNTRESGLERFDAELLPSQLQQASRGPSASAAVIPTTRQSQYFRWFLGAVLVLLLVETSYAWYLGSDRR